MQRYEKIQKFAEKYLELYRSPEVTVIQVEESFDKYCFEFSFKMDT